MVKVKKCPYKIGTIEREGGMFIMDTRNRTTVPVPPGEKINE